MNSNMAKKASVKTAADIASELLECRKAINEWKAIEKPLSDALKQRIKAGEQQEHFKLTVATSFKVQDPQKALQWANKYAPAVVTVDATAARRVFLADTATGSMGTPESQGFQFLESERLVATGSEEIE